MIFWWNAMQCHVAVWVMSHIRVYYHTYECLCVSHVTHMNMCVSLMSHIYIYMCVSLSWHTHEYMCVFTRQVAWMSHVASIWWLKHVTYTPSTFCDIPHLYFEIYLIYVLSHHSLPRISMSCSYVWMTEYRLFYRALLQNIVSFIGLFCKRDLSFYRSC